MWEVTSSWNHVFLTRLLHEGHNSVHDVKADQDSLLQHILTCPKGLLLYMFILCYKKENIYIYKILDVQETLLHKNCISLAWQVQSVPL